MKQTKFLAFVGASMLASSMLFLPITATFAQTPSPRPETRQMDTADDDDNTGLWGLLGLAGLIGLAGLRWRPEHVRAYTDPRDRSKV